MNVPSPRPSYKNIGKAIPITDRDDLQGCKVLRILHCLDNRLPEGGEAVSLMRRLRSTQQKHLPVLISVRGRVNPMTIVRLEGLGKLKEFRGLIGIRSWELPACSIVPPPFLFTYLYFILRRWQYLELKVASSDCCCK
jgi:hypothetical protein